jgi:hypothetical protein
MLNCPPYDVPYRSPFKAVDACCSEPDWVAAADSYFAAVAAQGGVMSIAEKAAFNTFISSMIDAGFWSRVVIAHHMGAVTPQARLVCMKNGSVGTFNGTLTHDPGVGTSSNGTNGYFDTGITGDATHARGWDLNNRAVLVDFQSFAGGNATGLINGGNPFHRLYNDGTNIGAHLGDRGFDTAGSFSAPCTVLTSNPAGNMQFLWATGTGLIASRTDPGGSNLDTVTERWFIHANSTAGNSPASYTTAKLGLVMMSQGFTQSEAPSLLTMVATLRNEMSAAG